MVKHKEHCIDCNVLVVGGGMAACLAAIRAKEFVDKVVLVCKATAGSSGASIIPNGWMNC